MDIRFGLLASLLVNIHRDPKKGKPVKPEDFFPNPFEDPGEKLRQQVRALAAWQKASGTPHQITEG